MNGPSVKQSQDHGIPEFSRLHRAIDRYMAVGWPRSSEPGNSVTQFNLYQQALKLRKEQAPSAIEDQTHPGYYGNAGACKNTARHETVSAADRYIGTDDLCVISCFFNPCAYRSRVDNFMKFADSLSKSERVHWRSIECAFGNSNHMLPPCDYILRVRSNSILWQKERLLNRLVSSLPQKFKKVAWVDADVLFSNPYWIVDASSALEESPVVQLFTSLARVDDRIGHSEVDILESFASLYRKNPDGALGPTYFQHGHTGLAWAGRREWIERYGLYDCCLSGTGDHLMAHAFIGDWQPECIGIGQGPAYLHFVEWCKRVYPSLRARLGVVAGQAISLWHGPESARDYYGAVCAIRDFGFDPMNDLGINNDGCWEWATDKPDLHWWACNYFSRRREDG